MTFLEILLEGEADAPAVKNVLERRFQLIENQHFRLHTHWGKGRLPSHPNTRPDPRRRGLLDQLAARMRGYSGLPQGYCVVVLLDADDEDCRELKARLLELYRKLPKKPACVLFRIAVEETESWFLAEPAAIRAAFPHCDVSVISRIKPDQVIGAAEQLALALGRDPRRCSGSDKKEWAERITPHLDLQRPKSPSLRAFIEGIAKLQAQIEP